MKLKTQSRILLTTAFISTLMSTCGAHAVLPQFSPEQIERANAFFAAGHHSWDEHEIKSFFEICFCNPENGERITGDELKNDPGRMSLLYKLFVDFDKTEFLVNRPLHNCVWEYGYMQMAQDFYLPSEETRSTISLFDEFRFEALKWHLEGLRGEKLKVRINRFLDKFSSDHADIGGINAQNYHGNTLMHDAVRFLGLGGLNGIGNREILYIFMECLLQRDFNLNLISFRSGKTAVELAHSCHIKLPQSIIRAVSRSYSFDDFYEEARKWVDISDESVLKANMNRFLDEYVARRADRGGINAKDIFGNTILHIAIPVLGTDARITSSGFTDYVGLNNLRMLEIFIECLLERKIDVGIRNYLKASAVSIAKRYKISPGLLLKLKESPWHFPEPTHFETNFGTIGIIPNKIPHRDLDTVATSALGSRYLFKDFHEEAKKWVDISDEEVLKERMYRFIDKFIVEHESDINTQNAYGNTILHDAVIFLGSYGFVGFGKTRVFCLHNSRLLITFAKCLRERGIRPNIVNNKGKTAMDLAQMKRNCIDADCVCELSKILLLLAY